MITRRALVAFSAAAPALTVVAMPGRFIPRRSAGTPSGADVPRGGEDGPGKERVLPGHQAGAQSQDDTEPRGEQGEEDQSAASQRGLGRRPHDRRAGGR